MKKFLVLILLGACCSLFSGCSRPDSLEMDLSRGYGEHLKLIHLNASTSERAERIQAFYQVLEESDVLDKDFSLFAYYPDYLLELTNNGETTTAFVDINGDHVDFYYADQGDSPTLYRSHYSTQEFKSLIHQV